MLKVDEKKSWEQPELIVLVRANPEEVVLAGCKIVPDATFKPGDNFNQGCTLDALQNCGNCKPRANVGT